MTGPKDNQTMTFLCHLEEWVDAVQLNCGRLEGEACNIIWGSGFVWISMWWNTWMTWRSTYPMSPRNGLMYTELFDRCAKRIHFPAKPSDQSGGHNLMLSMERSCFIGQVKYFLATLAIYKCLHTVVPGMKTWIRSTVFLTLRWWWSCVVKMYQTNSPIT